MKIVCDNCSTKYSIADEKVRGKVFKIKCKKCSHIIVVKGQEGAADVPPAGFDQKDTRVFDYSGFDNKEAAAGAPAADPIWHLVIDREQVGPLTVSEVAHKWAAKEIDAETYAWREGFADWQRLGAVTELASVTAGGERAGAPAPAHAAAAAAHDDAGGLFASAPAETGPTRPADPTDLFAGGAPPEDEGHGAEPGVFSSAPPSRRTPKEDLFASDDSVMPAAGMAAGPAAASMTGQRNENSVLFSLNNLAALATDTAAPARSAASSSASLGSSGGASPGFASSTGGSEGSGLIDIRAMAAMTLGAKRDDAPRLRASDDDLPVFSASSFAAPASAVLLPTAVPERNNKLVYIFIGIVGLLGIAVIVLAIFIFTGKKNTVVAQTDVPAVVPSASMPAPPPPPPAVPPAASTPAVAPTTSTPADAVKPDGKTPDGKKPDGKKPDGKKPDGKTPDGKTPDGRKPKDPTPPVTPATSTPVTTPNRQTCDEVACLVTPDLPCCPKKKPPGPNPPDVNQKDKLDQSDILSGMKSVSGRVQACNDRFKIPGQFKVKITVGTDGSVSSATAGAPIGGTDEGSCVESAVKGARFVKTKNAITFNYPYTFK